MGRDAPTTAAGTAAVLPRGTYADYCSSIETLALLL
jgi:hypothetical protein